MGGLSASLVTWSLLLKGGGLKGRGQIPASSEPPSFDHERIIELRKRGIGATEIAKAVGCKRGNVYKVLHAQGLA